jgi:EAL domain-containing protein (putative c-di-GMP-specific phosphodiesterase class I)
VITPSIGVATFPSHGSSAEELLRAADSALTLAKAAGGNCCRLFSTSVLARSLERLEIESDLRAALKKGEFVLFYQPKVDLATWSIVGAEALLRWRHPRRGWVSPGEFVPVAEESGLIRPLGQWVLQEACRQLHEWQERGLSISVAVNVSSEEFNQPHFAETLLATVRRSGVHPGGLELEITESLLMRNADDTVQTLRRLRAAGLGLAVDDFGTGYSSLSYLQEFPVHAVKIDQTFIRDLHKSRDNAAIVAAILAMARELGLRVIAEGVETEEQLEYLRNHRCDQIQGFLYSKPVPAHEFEAILARSHGTRPEAASG